MLVTTTLLMQFERVAKIFVLGGKKMYLPVDPYISEVEFTVVYISWRC